MNNLQIERTLSRNSFTKKSFIGVFSSDNLPYVINDYPACFVANVDPSHKPGSHWLAFYIVSPDKIEFFDSYGNHPSYFPKNISNYFRTFKYIIYNPMMLQTNVTAVCGQYCIYFLYSRCRGESLKFILSNLIVQDICNDAKVYKFVVNHFHVKVKFFQ